MRLYSPPPLALGELTLSKDKQHRIFRVMRLAIGDSLEVFDGFGGCYRGTLISSSTCLLNEVLPIPDPPSFAISLGFGICQMHKVEWILQKATELGVVSLYPIICERSHSNHAVKRYRGKEDRLEKIIEQACEQSGRCTLPTLHQPVALSSLVENTKDALVWTDFSGTTPKPKDFPNKSLLVLVGPEGGFSVDEKAILTKQAQAMSLGSLTLRCETASLAALAVLQAMLNG